MLLPIKLSCTLNFEGEVEFPIPGLMDESDGV